MRNSFGNIIFHNPKIKCNSKLTDFLCLAINKGFDINATNNKGQTIFHLLEKIDCDLVAFLRIYNFDFSKRDYNGNTIFHFHYYIPMYILTRIDFDINIKNNNGLTMADMERDDPRFIYYY